jgi:dephospho-CoA kinase
MMIGVTGSFGSGKSTVTDMLRSLGAHTIDADMICRKLMLPGKKVYRDIIKRFGKEMLNKNKTIDRVKLAGEVFNDASKLRLLNSLVHPEAIKEISDIAQRGKGKGTLVIDGALLIETGFYKKLDALIVVRAGAEDQIRRLISVKGITREEIVKRLRSQAPLKKKLAFADFVIDNSGSKKETRTQVKNIWEKLGGSGVPYGRKSKTRH